MFTKERGEMKKQFVRIGDDTINATEIVGVRCAREFVEIIIRGCSLRLTLDGRDAKKFKVWFDKTFADEIEDLG